MESVASRHIGLSVSSGQVRYALNRLWNPRTEKGLLATLRKGSAVKLVADILSESDKFFENVEGGVRRNSGDGQNQSLAAGESGARKRAMDGIAHPPRRTGEGQCHAADPAVARGGERTDQDERGQGHRAGTGGMQSAAGRVESRGRGIFEPAGGRPCLLGGTRRQDAARIFRSTPRRWTWRIICAADLFESDTSVIMTSATTRRRIPKSQTGLKLFFQTRRLRIRARCCRSARRSITSGR